MWFLLVSSGCLPWCDHFHPVRSVHRPLPCGHQCPDVLWDDWELHLHYGKASSHLDRSSAIGSPGAPHTTAGSWRHRNARRASCWTLHHQDIHLTTWHALCPGIDLWGRSAVVVLWLLLLPPHPLYHWLLIGDGTQDPACGAGQCPQQQEADPTGEPDELHSCGSGNCLWCLCGAWEHLQHSFCIHGGWCSWAHHVCPPSSLSAASLLSGRCDACTAASPVSSTGQGLSGMLLLLLL